MAYKPYLKPRKRPKKLFKLPVVHRKEVKPARDYVCKAASTNDPSFESWQKLVDAGAVDRQVLRDNRKLINTAKMFGIPPF